MLSCRRASERLSRALDGKLRPGEELGLWAHLLLCGPCCRYRKQLRMLDAAARQLGERAPDAEHPLPDAAKTRIGEALARQLVEGG